MKNKGTFKLNKQKPFYSWYQYLEGYSEELVESEVKRFESIKTIYDPFGGSGTTLLYSSLNGIKSYYSETNPFMRWVTETKINSSRYCFKHYSDFDKNVKLIIKIIKENIISEIKDNSLDEFSKYYDIDVYNKIIAIKSIIEKNTNQVHFRNIFLLALVSNLVPVSNTVRRGDLRYATEKENSLKDKDIINLFINKLDIMRSDIKEYGDQLQEDTILLEEDVRDVTNKNLVDCVITSPPYLNGTNYIRNTKLELNLLGFINSEKEMSDYHSKGIIAGINNVSKKNDLRKYDFDFLQSPVTDLIKITYDKRIPRMITGYFDNMFDAIKAIYTVLKPAGYLSLDIGDSQFSGIHIKTDKYLKMLCERAGFMFLNEEVLRKRRSNNGMILSQRIIRFKVDKNA